jgi:hypothetical protein
MIWVLAFLIESPFEEQLGAAGGFVLLILGIIGVWFGLAVRKECKGRDAMSSASKIKRDSGRGPRSF